MTIECSNPYPGPESFARGDARPYFGRDQETSDVTSLAVTERLLVFYAPSGAGKTSLLNKRVIPRLEEKLYEVLPTARVSGAASLPAGVQNVYAYNLMLRLAPNDPEPQRFAQLSLSDFLWHLSTEDGKSYHYDPSDQALRKATPQRDLWPRVLILDQFEEIVTSYPTYWSHREEFFRQLDAALSSDALLRVIMSLRSDYVQDLERYAGLLQHGLRARYQMFLMGTEDAHLAIEGPAAACGRTFEPGVAQQLVRNMSQVREADVDGKVRTVPGEAVEPIQLQVVCYQLWESMKNEPGNKIEMKDLRRLARAALAARTGSGQLTQREQYELLTAFVDGALGAFYETALEKSRVSASVSVDEAFLRNWFSTQLITESGTRGFMQRGHDDSGGVPEEIVQKLVDNHLLRSDTRGSVRLVELIHDRFVEPIRAANLRWTERRRREQPWIDDAYRWGESGDTPQTRNSDLLLRDERLAAVLAQTAGHQFEPVIEKYLEASHDAQQAREQAAKQELLQLKAEEANKRADLEAQANEALRRQYAAETERANLEAQANEALRRQYAAETERANLETKTATALRRRMFVLVGLVLLAVTFLTGAIVERNQANDAGNRASAAAMVAVAEKERANAAATAAVAESERADQNAKEADSLRLAGEADHAIDPDLALALALAANRITAPGPPEAALTSLVRAVFNTGARQKLTPGAAIYAADHHPATGRALLGGANGSLTLWDLTTGEKTKDLTGHAGTVWTAAISEDGAYALSGDSEGRLFYWDLDKGELIHQLPGHTAADGSAAGVWRALFVSPPPSETAAQQGEAAAPPQQALSAGSDGLLRLWDLQTGEEIRQLRGHRDRVYSLAVSPDGSRALSGSEDGQVLLWDLTSPGSEPVEPLEHPGWVRAVAFSPDGRRALSAGGGQIKLWQLDDEVKELRAFSEGQGDVYYALGFAPDGISFYSAGLKLRRWDVERGTPTPLEGHAAAVRGLSLRSDDQGRASLLSAGLDGAAILWDLATGALQQAYPLAAADEVVAGASGTPIPQDCTGRETYGPIAVGVEVILGQHDVMNGDDNWNAEMNQFVGRTARVTSLDGTDGENCLKVRVDIDGGRWVWRIRNLQLVGAAGAAPAVFAAAAYSVTQTSSQHPHLLLAASRDYLDLWDKNVGQLLARQPISLTLAGQAPACLQLASPRSAVVRGGQGRIVRIDLVTGKSDTGADVTCEPPPATPAAPAWTHPLAAATFSPDGKWAAATDRRSGWQAWPVGDPDAAPVEAEREGLPLSSVAPGPGDTGILAGSFAGEVLLWQRLQDAPAVLWPTSGVTETGGPVYDLAVNGDRTRGLSAHADGSLRLWDLEKGRLLAQDKAPQTQSVATPTPEFQTTPPATLEAARSSAAIVSVAMDADGTLALSGGLDGSLHLWEINADGLRWLAALPAVDSGPVWDVALSEDGSRGLSAHQNGALVMWDIPTRKEFRRLVNEGPPIYAVRFDPLDIVSGDNQGKITIWNPRSGRNIFSFDQAGGAVAALALNSDGTGLLTSNGATLYRYQLLAKSPEELIEDPGRFVLRLPCSDWQERYTLDKALWPDCLEEGSQVASAPGPTPTPAPVRTLEPKPAVMGANPGFIAPRTRERWRFEITRSQFLIFTAQAARPASGINGDAERIERGKFDAFLRLFNPDGSERARNDDISKGANTDAQLILFFERGSHELEVSAWNDVTSGAYTLTIAPVASLLPGAPVTSTLAAGTRGYWQFVGEPGSMVEITLRSEAFDTYLELRDGDGNIIAENDDGAVSEDDRIADFILPGPGIHYLVAARGFSSEAAGEYQLEFQRRTVTRLPAGRGIPAPVSQSTWSFSGRAGEFVRITASGEAGPEISLRAASGAEMETLTLPPTAGMAQRLARLPQDGSYLVTTTAASADYRLSLDRLRPRMLEADVARADFAAAPLWACGPPVCTGLRRLDLQAPAAQPAMRVLGPEGAASSTAATLPDGSVAIPLMGMSQTGIYHILVAAAPLTTAYTLTISTPEQQPFPLGRPESIEGDTTAGILWTFSASAGQQVRIEMRKAAGSELDSYLELYGPNGQKVREDDDSLGDRNSLIEIILPASGEYTILPRGYDGQQGRYTLRVVVSGG